MDNNNIHLNNPSNSAKLKAELKVNAIKSKCTLIKTQIKTDYQKLLQMCEVDNNAELISNESG